MIDSTAESPGNPGCKILRSPQQRDLAFDLVEGEQPGIAFLGGFRSNMSGTKALFLERWCRDRRRRCLRLDYSGHGRSGGRFEDGCIGDWLEDAEAVFANVGQSPWILVGSSMGAWIALLLALRRPELCRALVTLAAATDFSERLIWQRLDAEQKRDLSVRGSIEIWSDYEQACYRLGQRFFEDGRRHLLLDREIKLDCPVRLIHGMADADVPWQNSIDTAARLRSTDVEVLLRKQSDHQLSSSSDLQRLSTTLDDLISAAR